MASSRKAQERLQITEATCTFQEVTDLDIIDACIDRRCISKGCTRAHHIFQSEIMAHFLEAQAV